MSNNDKFNKYRNHIVLLFNGLGVRYAVNDFRSNPGGSGNSIALFPYGSNKTYQYTSINDLISSNPRDVPRETENILNENIIIEDIWNTPSNWPESWSYKDASGNPKSTTDGGIDFIKYLETGNVYDIKIKKLNQGYHTGQMTVDGSSNGLGAFSFSYMIDTLSFSASKSIELFLKDYSDDSDLAFNNPTVNFTIYGNNNRFFYEYENQNIDNWDYATGIIPGSGNVLDSGILFSTGGTKNYGFSVSNTGESISNRWGPWYKQDAIANHTPNTMCTEVGVYFDGSGNQQIYTHPSHNAYYVSNDNPASYRDFRLERSLQCAWAGRTGCRAAEQFGYMPYDAADPYNHNVVNTSSPLPANLFGL